MPIYDGLSDNMLVFSVLISVKAHTIVQCGQILVVYSRIELSCCHTFQIVGPITTMLLWYTIHQVKLAGLSEYWPPRMKILLVSRQYKCGQYK